MRWKDIKKGDVVYHTIFTHWGRGVVKEIRHTTGLENMFEKGRGLGPVRIMVDFEGIDGLARMTSRELRKTPNRKKIKDMVALYKKRGVDAVDGGHILILPKKRRVSKG